MSITGAINAAKSGLQVTGNRADTVASNIANASTPGYVRRAVSISESLTGGQTTGVRSDGIVRTNNDALTRERLALSSDLAQSNILSSAWQTISRQVGNTIDGGGLFQAFSNFEDALSTAALSPESTTGLSALLNAAKGVTNQLNSLSSSVGQLRADTDQDIADGVTAVNDSLAAIEDLNKQIAGIDRRSNQAAALLDERQRELDTIAQYIPVQAVPRDSGTIDVLTKEGVFLLAGTARTVEFTPSFAFDPSQTLASGQLSGLTVDGTDITPGAATFGAISSGVFGALFQLRDSDLTQFSAQLDTVSTDLISRLSDDAIDPTKTPGTAGIFVDTGNSADPGAAGRISVNAFVDPNAGGNVTRLRDGLGAATEGPPGNNTILNNLLDAVTSVRSVNQNGLQGSFSSSEISAHLSSIVGQTSVSQDAVLSSTEAQFNIVLSAEQSDAGVDIDQQLQDLLLIEQAYAANARVIEVANQLLNRLLEL